MSITTTDELARMPPGSAGRRRLFPSALVHELESGARTSGRRPRRTVRDWAVDFSCFLLAVVLGLRAAHSLPDEPGLSHPLAVLDQTLGAIARAAV